MPTSMTFETALLSDAIQKAAKIAPTKGSAFDHAAGLLFRVDPNTLQVVLEATNNDTTYRQTLWASKGTGDVTTWRIPSVMLANIVSTLPMSEGSTIDLIDRGDSAIRLSSGRVKVRLATMDPAGFPIIETTDPAGTLPANDMAMKVAQVAWSVEKAQGSPMSGVHVDGKRLIGCCHYSVAVVPCEVPIDHPVTVPLFLLGPLLKQASDIRVKATDKRLHIMLDAETATTAGLIEGMFPKVDNVMREDFNGSMQVNKQAFMDSLNRMLTLGRADRVPTLRFVVDGSGLIKTLTFDMEIEGVGRMQDSIDISTEFTGTYEVFFNPNMVQQAVDVVRGDMATIDFGHADAQKAPMSSVRVSDKHDYKCYIMPKSN